MFCVNCGVRLGDSEKKCPLCGTTVYHPEIKQKEVRPLYPKGRNPEIKPNSRAFNGIFIILFLIPLLICLIADFQRNGRLNWFGFAAGGIFLGYLVFAFPLWFRKPNPVILIPCDFFAAGLYLQYINKATGGDWFLSFAFPLTAALAIIVCTVTALTHYLAKGKFYIFGGGTIAFGAFMILVEFLLKVTFGIKLIGWSVYPFIIFGLMGGLLIYLGINRSAREMMERKLFF